MNEPVGATGYFNYEKLEVFLDSVDVALLELFLEYFLLVDFFKESVSKSLDHFFASHSFDQGNLLSDDVFSEGFDDFVHLLQALLIYFILHQRFVQ